MAVIKRAVLTDPDRGVQYTFRLNPDQYDLDSPFRVNVVHTAAGWFVDHYGPAVKTLSISGSTGKGFGMEYARLRDIVENWQNRVRDGERPRLLEFHNWESDEHYEVVVKTLRLRRNARAPLIYRYELLMAVISSDVTKRTARTALPELAVPFREN